MSTVAAPSADILIVGAGLAGLAAAVALAGTGQQVLLLDRKPYVGGRAYSYAHPALGEEIDSQHVLLGCCTNLIDLCAQAGASKNIRWYDRITFLEPASADRGVRSSEIGPGFLPAPSHSIVSFLAASMLGGRDKLAIARGFTEFLRGYPASDEESFRSWLARTGQTELAIRHFWEPVVLATLNDSFDGSSAKYVGKVIHEMLLRNAKGAEFGIPTQPLSTFYAAFARTAESAGCHLRLRTGVESMQRSADGLWRLRLSDGGELCAPHVLLSLPFEATAKLLTASGSPSAQQRAVHDSLEHFVHAPITTIHLWFDRAVTELPHAALLDTRIQWMFNKTLIREVGGASSPSRLHYLELTISASHPELSQSRQGILAAALSELGRFFPRVHEARLVKSGVLKEARATFSVLPGLDRFRPSADAAGDGLFLAGDWTQTGWPSTMEGAVRSGRLAAEAITRAAGDAKSFLSPDLPASGLMPLFMRPAP